MIRLTFLGTKAEVEIPQEGHDDPQCREAKKLGDGYYHRFHSSLLLEADGKKLMLDAGEGHEETVARVKPDAILVTHAHPDHLSRRLEGLEPAIPVYMSEDTAEVVKLPNEQVFARDKPFEVAGFKVVAHPVVHSLVAPAVCFKVSKGNFTLVYAPDVLSIPDREDFLKGVDLYIGDGSSLTRDIIRKKDDKLIGHASMLRQLRWAEGMKQVLFTHVGHLKKTEADVNQALRIASDGKARLAQDGMNLEFESLQVTTETIAPVLTPALPGRAEPQSLIQDAERYDASAMRDDQLRDDWRIVCRWYSTLKSGGEIKFSEATIMALGGEILKELLSRKREDPSVFTVHPEEMKEHPRELYERITRDWEPEDRVFLETQPEDLEAEDEGVIEELVRQPFGSPGGKLWIARKIASLIPEHRVYVEPFAGAAAVFWAKEPSEEEALGDIDPEVMFAYRFIQRASSEDIARLRRYDWRHRRELFEELKNGKPKDDVERFRRFLYLRKASYGSRGVNFMVDKKERAISLDSFERWQERLKGVHLHTGSYEQLLDKYDSQDTFFYLDPPYPGHWQGKEPGFTLEHWERLIERLKKLKGKFILSLFRDLVETLPSGWHTRRIKTHRSLGQDNVGRVLHHYEYLAANFNLGAGALEDETDESLARIGHQPFGSQAGKTRLAPRIVKMIPPHKTYVEPFAGGAAVFWAKEPAEKEILNDKDLEIAFAYRFIKGLTEEQLRRLRRYDWRRTKPLFQRIKESDPRDDVERFRKFYYLAKASFGESRQTFGNEGADIDVEKLPAASERLKNVTILSLDYEPVVQRYDSADTFFYLDPPYPGRSFKGEFQFDVADLERLVKVLKGVKGRFILSLGAEHRKYLPASWWTKKVLVRRMLWLPQTDKRLSPNYELLAANFTPSKESLEALEADEAPGEEMVKLPEVEDFMVVPDFISLVGSTVTGENPQDLDVLIRSAVRSESLEVAIGKQLDPEKRGYLHFIYEAAGPHDDYIPIWDLVALRKPEIEVVEVRLSKGLAPGRPFTPLKTAGGYGELEFSVAAADKLWETWGQGYQDMGLIVQEKFDGYRLTLHRRGDRVFAFSEDAKRDIVADLPGVEADLQVLPDGDFILDGELLLYAEEAVTLNNPYKPGDKIERMDMASFLGKEPAAKFRAVCQVCDCLYLDSEDLHEKPQTERLEALHRLLNPVDTLHLKEVESRLVRTREEFLKAVEWAASRPHSEGAMVKVADSDYPLTGRSSKIAKLKNFKEIRGKVVSRRKTEAGAYVYVIALSDGSVIGSTYATRLEAEVGDILEVRATEVKVKEEDGRRVFTWDNPIVASIKPKGTALTTPEQAEAMARKRRGMAMEDEGETRSEAAERFWRENWHRSFPPSGKGEFCLLPNTPVFLADGRVVDLSALKVGDEIFDNGSITTVRGVYSSLQPKIRLLSVQGIGQLGASPQHPLLIIRGATSLRRKYRDRRWRRADKEAALFSAYKKAIGWAEAKDIQPGDALLLGQPPTSPLPEELPLSSPFWELLGWYVAEGNLSYRSNKGCNVVITQKKGPSFERICRLAKYLKLRFWTYKSPRTDTESIHIRSPLLSSIVSHYFHGRAKEKLIPPFVYGLEPALRRAFLMGLLKGDGHQGDKSWRFYTASRHLAYGVLWLSASLGAPGSLSQLRQGQYAVYIPRLWLEGGQRKRRLHRWYDLGNGLWGALVKGIEDRQEPTEFIDITTDSHTFLCPVISHNTYHHHWRGLSEEETKLSEEELLKTDHSVHGDLRFQFSDEALFGFTVFLGTTDEVREAGGDRLGNLPPDDKLQGAWKLRQPIAWLKVGREKPLVTAPGEVGATSEKYSKFFAEDWGTYEIGVWREHFFELFLHGRKLKGRYTIQYAPLGGRRVWLIGKPKDQTPYAEANKLEEVVKELKDKGQRYLVWARPGEKPELIEVRKLALSGAEGAEELTCPRCGETLDPGSTRLAKLSDDFHDVFRCPSCKHIFSPLARDESYFSKKNRP